MCEALAALRLGFLSRQIRNCHKEPDLAGVTAVLTQTDRVLHGLSNRMNGYQRDTVVEPHRYLRPDVAAMDRAGDGDRRALRGVRDRS